MEQTYNKKTKTDLYKIDPRAIVIMDGFNSRCDFGDLDELAQSIKENGILNPISVKPFTDNDGIERYKLVDGERRYRAVMSLIEQGVDIQRVPALFISKSTNEFEMILQQLTRNEGKRFNEYEMGLAYKKMLDVSQMTRKELALKLGYATKDNKGITWRIDVALKHLERDERVQELLRNNLIDGSLVRTIYQSYKDDELGAVNEILAMQERKTQETKDSNKDEDSSNKKSNKNKLTVKDLDKDGQTIIVKDSQLIKKGLTKLLAYLYQYADDKGEIPFELDFVEILSELKKGGDIKSILDSYVEKEID